MKFEIDPRRAILGALPKNSVGVEIGVHEGTFSNEILREVEPEHLHLIDPWIAFDEGDHADSIYGVNVISQKGMDQRYERVRRRYAKRKNVTVHRAFSYDVVDQFEDASLDFVYIDGDHSYEGVSRDIADYSPKVKLGGLLIGDDYRADKWWGTGIIRAFNDVFATGEYTVHMKIGTQIMLRKSPALLKHKRGQLR